MIDIASACVGVLIVRDNPCRANTTRARRAGHTKTGRRADATLPSSAEAKAALLYLSVQSWLTHANTVPVHYQSWAAGSCNSCTHAVRVPLPLLSKIRYPRSAANLKLNPVRGLHA